MATRTEERGRITARAPQLVVDELEEAAALVGVTVNQFIVQAAAEKARTIIDAYTRIELSRRDAAFIFCRSRVITTLRHLPVATTL